MPTILVTGSCGLIGSEVCRFVAGQGFTRSWICDRERVLALLDEARPDLIVHTAAQPSHDRAAESSPA
jgi:dTDP-4-dehydrorhamnose reductase